MTKGNRAAKRSQTKKKTSKRKKNRDIAAPQTQQPFEQDVKRRIGQYGGAGEPPLMKK